MVVKLQNSRAEPAHSTGGRGARATERRLQSERGNKSSNREGGDGEGGMWMWVETREGFE